MYWYIKYPLIVILCLCVLALGTLLFRGCGKATPSEPATEVAVGEGPATEIPPSAANVNVGGGTDGKPRPSAPRPQVTKISKELEDALASAEDQLAHGMLEAAREIARNVIASDEVTEFDATWYRAAEILNEADKRLMNSTAPASEKKMYRVVRGDNLTLIARRNYTSVGALKRINENLHQSTVIRPSQTIMYIAGNWRIRVSKRQYLLMLYLNDELYRIYTVGIGRDNRTPTGTFQITELVENPPWFRNDGQVIPFGDPENPLGTRWMRLKPTDDTDSTLEGYGIHGTSEPESCGSSCSLGCVRMRNEEVEELFAFIPTPGEGLAPLVRVTIEE
ncbi:MAG: L,D-transpeptidase family protein [Victivallales bacterium]|nr:L,D-transpeptidase family protein [Victivallales bacterium]